MRLRLALSAPLDSGDPYLRAIVAALRGLAHSVDAASFGRMDPDRAELAAARMLESIEKQEHLIIEAMCLPAFARLAEALADRDATLFVREPAPHEHMAATLPHMRRVIVTAEAARPPLSAQFGAPAERIRVVEPGADAGLPRSEGPSSTGACSILAIDSSWPRSDHAVLLRALARLPDLDWTLTIAGGTPDPSLIASAAECGIAERTRFTGTADAPTLDQLWQNAGLLALAAADDGDGLVIAEAMQRGIPVAVAAGAAIAGSVPHQAGVIAAQGDYAALSNGMRRIIFDHDLRRDIAEAAWTLGRALPSWDVQARRFATALED